MGFMSGRLPPRLAFCLHRPCGLRTLTRHFARVPPMNDYYVYVYLDPRNFEEFYFGKGRGSRKDAPLSDPSDTEKTRRIDAIRQAGLEPIIRVIARNLSEH